MTKEELVQIIKDNFTTETKRIDLSYLDFSGYDVELTGLNAITIWNDQQKARDFIKNDKQEAYEILNYRQIAEECIYNDDQDCGGVILNSYQTAKRISNTEQEGYNYIMNNRQETGNFINNENQNSDKIFN